MNREEYDVETRERYDPLAHLVRPHITPAFPFESQMTNEKLADMLDMHLVSVKPFDLAIGKLPTVQLLNDAYNDVKSMNIVFSTKVNEVAVEMIGDREESIIVIKKELL